jgi:PAS domain S-box-containing protein
LVDTALLALIGGLLLTGIMAGSFFTILGREAETHRYARDLLDAKVQLEAEAVEREQARVELATSEERFRRVFDGAPVGIGTASLEGKFLEVNPVMYTMLRCKEDELIGRSISEFVHPDDVEAEQRQLERLVRNEAESVQYTERMVRHDGTEMWAELNVSLLRDAAGTPLYFVGQVKDITARREINERLRRAWSTQEKILDTIPVNIFLKNADGVFRFINAAGLEFLGRQRDEVVGKTDFDIFPADVAERLNAIDRQVLATGEPVSGEEKVMVGGRSRTLLSGKTSAEIEGWEGVHVLEFSIDMTPIKEAEEALGRSEYRFRQLIENMSSGVAVYEAVDGGKDFVFLDYNRAAEEMGGHSREEVLGKRLTDIFPGADEMGLVDLLANVWRTGEPRQLEARLYRDSRHEGWRENYAYKLPTGEVVAIYDDAGERKRLEAELLHAQKMEAVGRLAGGVAHDFNNLLQVVLGNTDLLLAGAVDEKLHGTMLREIYEQAERGTHLARRLLTFSRRESHAPVAIDLGDVIRGAETLVRRLLKENIDLVIEPAAEPLPILGDSGQLEQVLMNLVVNASDAMPEGGSLTIRSGTESDDLVWLTVADTGPGIAEAVLGKVFDPYFTTKSAAQGTGLGLAVVDGIVSRHDGRIEVDSRPGRGVRFKVVLPRNVSGIAEVPRPADELRAAPAAGAGRRVLVVEDQELVRRTIETMLSSLGYVVESAADGVSARKMIQAQQFDIMVSDIVLPDTTGVELAHEIRVTAADFPVLLVSGYAEEAVRERGAEFRFLQKPFRLDDLARQVAAALAERTSTDDS